MKINEKYEHKFNSESAYYDVDNLKKQNLQWFNLDDIINYSGVNKELLIKYICIWIINLKKNCGKTYWIINQTNELCEKCINGYINNVDANHKFVLLFRTDTILKARINEINLDDNYKYYIIGNKIFSKGEKKIKITKNGNEKEIWDNRNIHVGFAFGLNSMDNYTGFQFHGVKKVFYDEYRSKRTLSYNQRESEFRKFYIFLDNVQRDKNDLQVYLFGNNEDDADPIAEGFFIDKTTDYFIDLEGGVFYFNVDFLKGATKESRLANRLAKYSPSLKQFIEQNQATDTNKAIIPMNQFPEKEPWAFILVENIYYRIRYNNDIYYIDSIDDIEYNEYKSLAPSFCFLSTDSINNKHLKQLPYDKLELFSKLYKHDKLLFWSINDRTNWLRLFDMNLIKLIKN